MKVAVFFFPASESSRLSDFARAVAKGLEAQGKQADVLNAYTDQVRATMYSYVCMVIEPQGLFCAKPQARFKSALDQMSGLAGKRLCVFVRTGTLLMGRFEQAVMKMVEAQGLFMRNSFSAKDPESFGELAKTLDVELLPKV